MARGTIYIPIGPPGCGRAAFRSGGNYGKPVSPDEGWSFEVFRTVRVDDY